MSVSMDVPRSYFNSMPGTPAAHSRRTSGADIYASIMGKLHHEAGAASDIFGRRVRKAAPLYLDDAAGLTNNTRAQARRIPHKGKGSPPPDNFEPGFKASKKYIPGRSFAAASELLAHQEHQRSPSILSMSLDGGMMSLAMAQEGFRPSSATGARPCLRINESSFRSSLQGSGLSVIAEQPIKRPIRKPGTAAPTADTKARVLVFAEELPMAKAAWSPEPSPTGRALAAAAAAAHDSFNSPRDAMLGDRWARDAYEGGMGAAPSRPATAPCHLGSDAPDNRSEARKRYHEAHSNSNLDIYRQRHTGGICPAEYKLDDARMPAPQLTSPRPDSAREAYYASRVGYASNRVKSLISLQQYA